MLFYFARHNELEVAKQKENSTHGIEGMFAKIRDEQIRIKLGTQSLKLEQKTLQTNFFVAIAIITFLFATISFYYYQKQKRLGVHLEETNQQVTKQNNLIDRKNKDLEALNDEKNDLINIVAHDLKNPLANIMGSTHLLKEELTDAHMQSLLDIVEGSSVRMLNMITKILDVDAIERGLDSLDLKPVNLSDIMQATCDHFENQAEKKEISIQREIRAGVMVLGDPTHIHQVVENLVSNAIKFSPWQKNIYIVLATLGEGARIEKRDEGPGISEEEQNQLFQMYGKLSATPTGQEKSTGLGLSIAQKFVDAMGGKIWCKSKVGSGTSFFVLFRLR